MSSQECLLVFTSSEVLYVVGEVFQHPPGWKVSCKCKIILLNLRGKYALIAWKHSLQRQESSIQTSWEAMRTMGVVFPNVPNIIHYFCATSRTWKKKFKNSKTTNQKTQSFFKGLFKNSLLIYSIHLRKGRTTGRNIFDVRKSLQQNRGWQLNSLPSTLGSWGKPSGHCFQRTRLTSYSSSLPRGGTKLKTIQIVLLASTSSPDNRAAGGNGASRVHQLPPSHRIHCLLL